MWHKARFLQNFFLNDNIFGRLVGSHVGEMLDAGLHVVADGGEVDVGNLLLVAELLDDRGDGRVVNVVDPGKEVMLDLVVEPAVEGAEPLVADVRGGDDLW